MRVLVRMTLLLCAGPLALAPSLPAQERNPDVLLEKARYEAEVRGDVEAAIRIYTAVVEQHADRRDVAARALLALGEAYESLGREGAREAYGRIVAEYGDQVEPVEAARVRLAALARDEPGSDGRVADFSMRRLWATPAGMEVGSLSPDGRRVAFVDWGPVEDPALRGHADIALWDLEKGRASLVTDLPSQSVEDTYPEGPVWSRDGRWLAYSHWDGGWTHKRLHVVRADGSEPRVLIDNQQFADIRAMAFSKGGDFLVARIRGWDERQRIARISTADGEVTTLKTLGTHPPHPLSLSPDDRWVVYDELAEGSQAHDVVLLAADGSGEVRLTEGPADDHAPFWTPDGRRVVFLSDRSGRPGLWSVRVEGGRAAGEPELVRDNVGAMDPLGFTDEGALYYRVPVQRSDVLSGVIAGADAGSAEPRPLTGRFVGMNGQAAWSPDGERVAWLSRRGGGGDEYHLVVQEVATGAERAHPLPFIPLRHSEIDWAGDGGSVFLESGALPRSVSHRVDVTTGEVAGVPRRESAGYAGGDTYAWATERQAEYLRALGIRVAGQRDFRLFEEGEETLRPGETLLWVRNGVQRYDDAFLGPAEALTPLGHMHTWRLSPDGTTLALAVSSDPELQMSTALYLLPVAGGEPREIARIAAADDREIVAVRWAPEGDRIFYAVGDEDAGRAVEIYTVGRDGGEPRRLDLDLDAFNFAGASFHPDGRTIAFTTEENLQELWVMEGLEW